MVEPLILCQKKTNKKKHILIGGYLEGLNNSTVFLKTESTEENL